MIVKEKEKLRVKLVLTTIVLFAMIVVGFQLSSASRASALSATVDIEPETLNVNMKGRWIIARIGLPEGYSVRDIDTSTILLEDLFGAEWSSIEGQVLIVKFGAPSMTDYLWAKLYHMGLERASIGLKITFQLNDGTYFEGSDTITAIDPPMQDLVGI